MTASFSLTQPRRRPRVFATRDSPLPIPLRRRSTETPSGRWRYYSAYVVDGHILVKHSGDIEYLYSKGYFGKGTLSRHRPTHGQRCPSVCRSDGETNRQTRLRVTSRRQYLRHAAWLDSDVTCDGSMTMSLPLPRRDRRTERLESQPGPEHQGRAAPGGQPEATHAGLCESSATASGTWSKPSVDTGMSESVDDPWAETDPQTSHSFWTMETESTAKPRPDWEFQLGGESQQTGESPPAGDSRPDWEFQQGVKSQQIGKSPPAGKSQQTGESNQARKSPPAGESRQDWEFQLGGESQQTGESSPARKSQQTGESHQAGKSIPLETCTDAICLENPTETDPQSAVSDDDADLLVVDDTEDSDIDVTMATRAIWRPVAKHDPLPVTESLELSMEETYFLSYALGCLVVHDVDDTPLTLSTLWRWFCGRDPEFLARYAVYHSLRTRGWVPKAGLKYGTDFVLYWEGPAFYHSSYSVLVRHVTDRDFHQKNTCRAQTWTALAALNRATEQVAKEVMLCYVIEPEEMTAEDKLSPKCLSSLRIQEVVLRRWMSKQERENAEFILIP